MAARQVQNKRIYIETEYDNILVVNPNEIYGPNGARQERLVDHEDLVYYANLETFLIPRTKLAIGEAFPTIENTTIATLFGGEEDLKVNFLKPKGKQYFDTSWSNQLTGEGSRGTNALNQTVETPISVDGRRVFQRSVKKYEDTQLLGIKSIRVNIKGTGVPEVNIEMVDIQGRSLFEQGDNSLYSAFFNYPYPLFYLTLKGYYGKAIRYRLSLLSFNATFDADTGNYNISLKLIGKFTALLFDTPLAYAVNAPKMYNTQITVTEPNGNKSSFNTYKGRQKLNEVYDIYERKGLIPKGFPRYSLEEFVNKAQKFTTDIQTELSQKKDFTKLNDLEDFSRSLDKLNKEIYEFSINNVVDRSSFYVVGEEIYYPFKKELTYQSREDFKIQITKRIQAYTNDLKRNTTFGENPTQTNNDEKYQINVTIKGLNDILKKLDFNAWSSNKQDVVNTYQVRYPGRFIDGTSASTEYQNFLKKEQDIALLDTRVKDENGDWIEETPDYLVFGDKLVADGTYVKNSYLDKLDIMSTSLKAKQKIIEDDLTKFYSEKQLKNPSQGGLGFKPSIRNVFAIIFAGADAFYRLMEENHEDAWNVRTDKSRVLSVIGDKNYSVDALNTISKSSTELNDNNVVYPWPLYFTLEKQDNGSDLYTIQYPGDAKYITRTKAYDYKVWPEVGFVEAYIKSTLEKEKEEKKYTYDNEKDVTKFVSCNAIEFPFKTAPYQDLNAIKTFYEIFERTYLCSYYGNLPTDISQKKQIDKFYGDIESENIKLVASSNIEINQILKTSKFDLKTLIEYMKKISNDGKGQSWQTFIRDYFNTEYIKTLLDNVNEIYSIDTIDGSSIKVSAILPLSKNMKEFLEDSGTSKKQTLDVYPFTDTEWLKKYMSNGDNLSSFEDYNNTTRSYIYLDDKKTIARVNATEKYQNLKLFTSNSVFGNNTQPLLSNSQTGQPIDSQLALKNYYTTRTYEQLYLTESYVDYGTSYTGNVGTSIQTTSLLNTPYFVNALMDGVQKQKVGDVNPFAALGYMYLNSLPLITTKEKIKDITNNVTTDLDYLAATFNKFSSIHQVPYAWILKYGSIWHRYKTYVEKNIDILEETWKDFDYTFAYDPNSGNTFTTYTILNYSGTPTNISLQKPIITLPPLFNASWKDYFDTGFYPGVINSIEYYLNGKDLITGYSASNFSSLYTNDGLRIGINPSNQVYSYGKGFDPSNPIRELIKRNLFSYRTFRSPDVDGQPRKIIMYPSMGGIPFDQSIYECFTPQKKMTEDLYENKSMFNGTVRSVWGMSHFGYFNSSLLKMPLPTEYLKIVKTNTDKQNDFDITNTQSKYSMIDEIFSIFDVNLLDKMEEKFLNFCKFNPTADDLKLNDENITPSYIQTNGLTNGNLKSLKPQIENIFSYQDTFFEQVNETVDTQSLMNQQINNMYESIKSFVNFDCILKIANPINFNKKLFNSFSTLASVQSVDKLIFDPYVKGSLPGDGTSTTLLQSTTSLPQSWATLRKYLGFSLVPNVDYPNQVNNVYPSVPSVSAQTSVTTATTSATTVVVSTPLQLEYRGDSSTIFPSNNQSRYINVRKSDGNYQVFKFLGETNVNLIDSRIELFQIFEPNSNIEDLNNVVQSSSTFGINNNYSYVVEVQDVPGLYQLVITYSPNTPTSFETTKIVANISTIAGLQTTIPQTANASSVAQPLSGTQSCAVADFFIENNIRFTSQNIINLYPIIRLYVEQKRLDPGFNKNKLNTLINNFLQDRETLQNAMVNETFTKLNKDLKNIEVDYGLPQTPLNGDTTKLSLYNTLKTFNDKWIAGSDLKTNTLFEDFLFMDRSNSDLGDSFTLDLEKVVNRLNIDSKQDQSLMNVVSNILEDNYFIFMAMPAYVNFYGIQQAGKNGQPSEDSQAGNSLFGTYLEVDYTQSSPKFLCLYVGNPSEYPKPKENSFNRFGDDSFDLRVSDNPLRVSDPNRNYSLNNRVVGFAVDFGIRNQNMFKSLGLDMSEMKNTSETYKVYADMGNSVSGDKVAQQSQSLYSIYKSRSYNCTVQSMGNAMIQPTMYFILRHVPMFYGPYWITEVNHNISERGFDTEFKGSRIPKYALPKVDNLLASVNKQVIATLKQLAGKDKSAEVLLLTEEEKNASKNPTLQTLNGDDSKCQQNIPTEFASIPFETLVQTPFTITEIIPFIEQTTTDKGMRALLLGLAQILPSVTENNGMFNSINFNPYEILTVRNFGGGLNSLIKKQSCVSVKNNSYRFVKFDSFLESIQFVKAYMTAPLNNLNGLVSINPNSNQDKSYGAALFQIAYTSWLTNLASGNPTAVPPVPPLTTTAQIKSATQNKYPPNQADYQSYVQKFTDAWVRFK